MKAALRKSYGPPEIIQVTDVESPSHGSNEVLVKVFATTVNRTDCANLTAKPFLMRLILGFLRPKKVILGTDFAGEVVGVGKEVKTFKLKDRLIGFNDLGYESQAEYLTIPEDGNILKIPPNTDYAKAVASIEGAHYAYTFIHKTKIKAGNKILINGATGAIGSALLQFVKKFDVFITATCNTKNVELVRSLGADRIIDYSKEDFTKDLEKYDFVFDAVGKSTFGKCKSILNKGGVYISSELGPFAQNLVFALMTPILGGKQVIFPIPFPIKRTMPYILNLLKKEIFNPVIDRVYKLNDIDKAYEYALSGEKTGNIIIKIAEEE